MRKVILFVNATIDGYIAGPNGELDWMMVPDPVMNVELTDAMRARVDTILSGRNAYNGLDANFRNQAADPASPPELVEFANWMLDTPQVVFSRSQTPVREPARLATADIPDEIATLKGQPGKDMVLFGGVETVQQFVRLGLVDEYWIKLYPTALGAGQPLFTDLDGPRKLSVVDSKTYDSGIITVRYVPA